MTPADLVSFVLRERSEVEAEERLVDLLSTRALVDRGDAIDGIVPLRDAPGGVWVRCVENISRFRLGDQLRLARGEEAFSATLLDVTEHGLQLRLQTKRDVGNLAGAPWTARAVPTDLSAIVLGALGKLQPGGPGWGLFRALAGEATEVLSWSRQTPEQLEALVGAVTADAGADLDASQGAVLLRCLGEPSLYGVQGPPGTGKTHVLAFVAEGLARMGKRVLLVAPTHQAVNNALSAVHRHFPGRAVVKVGPALRRESLADGVPVAKLDGLPGGTSAPGRVVGMTFLAALNQLALRTSAYTPHVLIVDEAGQLPLAQGAAAGLMGAGSTLLFGDDMQMPPVFSGEVAAEPLAVSLFGQLRRRRPETIDVLRTTYRMNAELCAAVGGTFYPAADGAGSILAPAASAAGRRLRVGPSAGAPPWLSEVLDPERSLVWIDTDGTMAAPQHNEAEAACVAEILATCLEAGLPATAMAAVTPYRRQAVLARQLLQSRVGAVEPLPIVDTVERVQGLTVEVVVVSLCTSDPEHLRSNATFLLSPNRLNVALSRARTKAVLLAPAALLGVMPDDFSALLAIQDWRRILAGAHRIPLPAAARRMPEEAPV